MSVQDQRLLKYLLCRETLNNVYIMFIRPHLEYACEVWDGCTVELINKLEQVQLQAARIVTGLPVYTPREYLYFETGWEPLQERRRKRKLSMMYKIQNGLSPQYLTDLLPSNVASKSNYNLRNSQNISTPYSRLKISQDSFFPSAITSWNDLPLQVRQSETVAKFKSSINQQIVSAPKYYSYGKRKLNIIHTKLRYSASLLIKLRFV